MKIRTYEFSKIVPRSGDWDDRTERQEVVPDNPSRMRYQLVILSFGSLSILDAVPSTSDDTDTATDTKTWRFRVQVARVTHGTHCTLRAPYTITSMYIYIYTRIFFPFFFIKSFRLLISPILLDSGRNFWTLVRASPFVICALLNICTLIFDCCKTAARSV